MKTSAIKIVQSYFNKKNINNLKKFINARNIIIGVVAFFVITTVYYLLRPAFFDYESNKGIFEKKIGNYLKADSRIKGDISYYFFPRPRITVENLELDISKSGGRKIILKKSNFLISISKLKSPKEIKIKKAHVSKQRIKVYPSEFKNYVKYFEEKDVDNFLLKNCEIFFVDDQKNDISITNFNLKNTFDKDGEKISIKAVFSENRFKLNFLNKKNKEKYLNFLMPDLNTSLKIIFGQDSNLEKTSGKLNLKILNNILMLNFDGDGLYKISDSFFRNKFLNSKLDGTMNFEENFYFDLNFNINQVNLGKLFRYYDSVARDNSSGQFNISKKINGKAKINLNRADSFFGRLEKANFVLLFENGNLKIKSGSADLGKNCKLKFNISLLGKGKDQNINFFISFLSNKGKKFLKKFNLRTEEENISYNAVGKIKTMEKKIKFDNLVVNKEILEGKNLNIVEDLFNKHVIQDSALGFLDFFKIKKFAFEVYKNLE